MNNFENGSSENLNNYRSLIESVIDWKKRLFYARPFFEFLFRKNRINTVLDLKSGSGNYIFNLYGLYNFALGVDSDPLLISNALKKSETFPGASFINMNFDKLKEVLAKEKFPLKYDSVFLFDNSLPTTINPNNIVEYLKNVNTFISSRGILIVSIFNYNKLLKNADYNFTAQKFYHLGSLYMLSRSMKIIDEDLISYSANIFDSSGHIIHEHKELQYPLTKKRLNDFLGKAGFSEIETYGDFSFSDFSVDDSRKIVAVAHKK